MIATAEQQSNINCRSLLRACVLGLVFRPCPPWGGSRLHVHRHSPLSFLYHSHNVTFNVVFSGSCCVRAFLFAFLQLNLLLHSHKRRLPHAHAHVVECACLVLCCSFPFMRNVVVLVFFVVLLSAVCSHSFRRIWISKMTDPCTLFFYFFFVFFFVFFFFCLFVLILLLRLLRLVLLLLVLFRGWAVEGVLSCQWLGSTRFNFKHVYVSSRVLCNSWSLWAVVVTSCPHCTGNSASKFDVPNSCLRTWSFRTTASLISGNSACKCYVNNFRLPTWSGRTPACRIDGLFFQIRPRKSTSFLFDTLDIQNLRLPMWSGRTPACKICVQNF